jgi:hypothetical protein
LNRYMVEVEEPAAPADRNLLEALADAAERTWDIPAAITYLNRALRVEMAPADYARMERKRNALEADRKRREENAKRQPVITNKLQQPQVVGVRITR